MAQLIDSSIFISMGRRGQQLDALAIALPNEALAMAGITVAELLVGVYRADSPQRRLRRESFVEAILEVLPVLPFDARVARTHAQILAQLMATGQQIGANDLQIAATALTHGYDVSTENLRDFERVPGLVVREPRW